ncbi:hypothetical protein [Lysinibacillus fusiformis]|uniref:hypothetical protein n=1 Tax=Lysinibacillus fusiformis TaxID=28031 RepID=UPI00263B5D3B|nr:hypothetical protein [Lysinibacillus fusiformis]MDC6267301.1 hypothetical protein [Lysinibacillus sphaericus]MDN4968265.1 hypothetical protein [Lysinibacillus fusiformis]MDN4968439.1 hypothetical protein [Lysinibacillus fusiformis]
MKSTRIYIYKNQISRLKLSQLIEQFTGIEGIEHNKLWSVGWFNVGSISFSCTHISISYFENGDEIKCNLIRGLKESLNAEKIIISENGVDSSTLELDSYRPKIHNRIKYKIKNIVDKW